MKLAIIPARGGSKRIPQKNVRSFCGKPMILWVLERLISSNLFDRVIVSTDDGKIAELAKLAGAEVPFIRPSYLSDDFTGTGEVIAHALKWIESEQFGDEIELVACVYPTAPFLVIEDLEAAIGKLQTGNWDYVFSATDFASPIFRAFKVLEDGGVEMIYPEHYLSRSQELSVIMHDAAQFYLAPSSSWLKGVNIFSQRSFAYYIPRWRVQDIDNEDDWRRAELLAPLIFRELNFE